MISRPEYAASDGAVISLGTGFLQYIAPTALGFISKLIRWKIVSATTFRSKDRVGVLIESGLRFFHGRGWTTKLVGHDLLGDSAAYAHCLIFPHGVRLSTVGVRWI